MVSSQPLPAAHSGHVMSTSADFAPQCGAVALCSLSAAAVAAGFRVPFGLLFVPLRCRRPVAQARQIAIYLVHIGFSISYTEVGRGFGRDRTTVSHACGLIEDLRERRCFDLSLAWLEAALRQYAAFSDAMGFLPETVQPPIQQ